MEKIQITDFLVPKAIKPNRPFYEDDLNEHFEFMDKKQIYFDPEKAYVTFEVIIRRNIDNKFFRFEYDAWGAGGAEIYSEAREVVQKQRIETYYE